MESTNGGLACGGVSLLLCNISCIIYKELDNISRRIQYSSSSLSALLKHIFISLRILFWKRKRTTEIFNKLRKIPMWSFS